MADRKPESLYFQTVTFDQRDDTHLMTANITLATDHGDGTHTTNEMFQLGAAELLELLTIKERSDQQAGIVRADLQEKRDTIERLDQRATMQANTLAIQSNLLGSATVTITAQAELLTQRTNELEQTKHALSTLQGQHTRLQAELNTLKADVNEVAVVIAEHNRFAKTYTTEEFSEIELLLEKLTSHHIDLTARVEDMKRYLRELNNILDPLPF